MAQTTTALKSPDPEAPLTAAAAPNAPSFIPMTQVDRVHYYFKSTFNPTSILASAASAGIAQWQDSPREWQEGTEGYGRRLGSAYAKHIIRQTMLFGASSVLHEDNRYIRSEQSGFGTRLKYAIASTLLARRATALDVCRLPGPSAPLVLRLFPAYGSLPAPTQWAMP